VLNIIKENEKSVFIAPLRIIVAPIPLTPFPLRKGGKIGGYRPCDLVWGFAPNPVYIDVCGRSYQIALIYDCRGRPPGRPAAEGGIGSGSSMKCCGAL